MVNFVDGLAAGTRIGTAITTEAIGRGGYGIVYKGTHDTIGDVAIKEFFPRLVASRSRESNQIVHSGSLRDSVAFDKGLENFLDEGRALSRINHPNIVGLHDVVEANGTAYVIMPLVKGDTLADILQTTPDRIDSDFIESLAFDLASALNAMHEKGLIHRDVAPDNILIEAGTDRPVLIDFGGAKQVVSGLTMSSDASLVKAGYSPPEQYPTGDVKGLPRGPWSDIYSLSAVLYLLVTGERPLDSVTRMEADSQVRAGRAGSGKANKDVLRAIDAGLNPAPQRRPQTIAAWTALATGEKQGVGKKGLLFGGLAATVLAACTGIMVHEPSRAALMSLFESDGFDNKLHRAALAGNCDAAGEFQRNYPEAQDSLAISNIVADCEAWSEARDKNSEQSYLEYLSQYDDGLFREDALAAIAQKKEAADRLAWSQAEQADSISSYTEYKDNYPYGLFYAEALARITKLNREQETLDQQRADQRAWEVASRENSILGFNSYLDAWPEGFHADEARSAIRRIEREQEQASWNKARREDKISAYNAYLSKYSNGAYSSEARRRIADIRQNTAWAKSIQASLIGMKFKTGASNGRWTSNTQQAATDFIRLNGLNIDASQPSKALQDAAKKAERGGYSNVTCRPVTRTVTEYVEKTIQVIPSGLSNPILAITTDALFCPTNETECASRLKAGFRRELADQCRSKSQGETPEFEYIGTTCRPDKERGGKLYCSGTANCTPFKQTVEDYTTYVPVKKTVTEEKCSCRAQRSCPL